VAEGHFREDLFARINLWTFQLPGLAGRPEDIEPNLDFELARHAREYGEQVRFNAEARRRYLDFATGPQACWRGNFRELGASVTRMATLASAGRITEAGVDEEILRLQAAWHPDGERGVAQDAPALADGGDLLPVLLGDEGWAALDLFDQVQLRAVVEVCRQAPSLSEAGRRLFAVSREGRRQPNDADRLRKYLARFGLSFEQLRAR
jgi:transcriptional regulatory protein RtcR